ncbi:MAG TPA: F390 synthetase-related protein [Steroidobacteraceae bacterium]|nr:F390 synthetase-related protein [Steroidobacteraceae bacterium]
MNARSALLTASAWLRARRIDALRDEATLRGIQSRWLARHLAYVGASSRFYRAFAGRPLKEWPVIGKQEWLANFDSINTAGATLAAVERLALAGESSRDFTADWNGHTVGLSTGTSGRRGLFLIAPGERARWAGTVLGRVLRGSPLSAERIALVLRAGSTLYESVRVARLRFRYFDPLKPWEQLCEDLARFDPTILIAPAQLLTRLAAAPRAPRPRRVISAAEVLDDIDRLHLQQAFGTQVEQIYQATEGFLGASCGHGTIHLNEPYLVIEPEWQDAARTRFVPIVTDLWRRAQPVVRYRLDDVLRVAAAPCPCGRPGIALAAIEGRCDDVLLLDGDGRDVAVFADQLARQITCTLARLDDYEVQETARGRWSIGLRPMPAEDGLRRLQQSIGAMAAQLGAVAPALVFAPLQVDAPARGKRRRIRGAARHACAS